MRIYDLGTYTGVDMVPLVITLNQAQWDVREKSVFKAIIRKPAPIMHNIDGSMPLSPIDQW